MLTRTALLLGVTTMSALPGAVLAADIPGDRGTTAKLDAAGTAKLTAFEFQGDSDWYRTGLEGGQTYTVRVRSSPRAALHSAVRVSLRTQAGRVLESATFEEEYGGGRTQFRAGQAGTHFLDVKHVSGPTPEAYEVMIALECPGDTRTTCTLPPGQIRSSLLETESDVDFYRVRLDSSQIYDVLVQPIPFYFVGQSVKVLDGGGGVVAERQYGQAPSIVGLKVPRTGTYFVALAEGGRRSGGYDYKIKLRQVGSEAASDAPKPEAE